MSIPGIPGEGFKTVGQINGTDLTLVGVGQDAMAVAVELLSNHAAGAPVVDGEGKIVGFISEIDLLDAIESGKDLERLQAQDIMTKNPVIVQGSTTLADAFKLMKENNFVDLPVEHEGRVLYSVSRHDLLRALIGLGPSEH